MSDYLYDSHLREIPILIWCCRCRRYISNEGGHGCDLTREQWLQRGIERRLKVSLEHTRRGAA